MINEVTLSYRLAGATEEATRKISAHGHGEKDAFDVAVEELKVSLLVAAMKTHSTDPTEFALLARSIVQLRPWAVSYGYGPKIVRIPTK